jgi:hypothetical protein
MIKDWEDHESSKD